MNFKNKIYEEYLKTSMHESDLIIKLDSVQSKNIKGNGVIYTPWNIVEEMLSIANPTVDMSIIEPSCGHGVFLIGLLYYMKNHYNMTAQEILNWFKDKVVGVEISQNTVDELKKILSLFFLKHFKLVIEPHDFTNIYCHDGLTFDSGKHFNLCIGNPPYIRAKYLSVDYLQYLKKTYASCKKGTIDLYFAFIEKYADLADSLVFITPNSFLTSKSGSILKNNIINKMTLLIDFKEKKVFKDASVYTCIFKTESSYNGIDIIYGNELNKLELKEKKQIFKNHNTQEGFTNLVYSGVATLCDTIYIVEKRENGKFYATYEFQDYEIEKNMVVPYLKLTKIKSNEDLMKIKYMIYPYRKDKGIILEEQLKKDNPLTYTYLSRVKGRLLQRDKGKVDKYESWYAYGRKQGLHDWIDGEIVVIPQMIGGECKPYQIDIKDLLSEFGQIVFTSGFIIPRNDKTNIACEYILKKDFIEFAKDNGKSWPGKNESYYSLTVKQIKSFKVT